MTDNSVSSSDSTWSNYSASSTCADFKEATLCSTNESGCEASETKECSTSLPTSSTCTTTTNECGSLPTSSSSTHVTVPCGVSTSNVSTHVTVPCGVPTSSVATKVTVPCGLPTSGIDVNVGCFGELNVSQINMDISCGCTDTVSSTSSCTTTTACNAATLTVCGDSIDTGTYTITGSSCNDGSVTVTDNCTGQVVTQVWGDPHVDDATGAQVGEFTNNNLDITLPDGTRILMEPTAATDGVAHIANATVVSGDQAVTINGVNGTFQNGVTTSAVFDGGSAQNAAYANGATELTLDNSGQLYVNTASGSEGQLVASNLDLDGLGGAASSMAA